MRISLSNYLITLALPAFYSPRRTLYFTLWIPPIGIVYMLWLPPLPALLWAPPRTAACTRLRRLYYYPARAPCLLHLPLAMRHMIIITTTTERMRISLSSNSITLVLPIFYLSRRALYFTLWMPFVSIAYVLSLARLLYAAFLWVMAMAASNIYAHVAEACLYGWSLGPCMLSWLKPVKLPCLAPGTPKPRLPTIHYAPR
jgi:hypothetical protein